jgi:hypothetical protein
MISLPVNKSSRRPIMTLRSRRGLWIYQPPLSSWLRPDYWMADAQPCTGRERASSNFAILKRGRFCRLICNRPFQD